MTTRVCGRAGCGKPFLSAQTWHHCCSPACAGAPYVLVTPADGGRLLRPGEYDIPGTYYVTFDFNPTVVVGAAGASDAVTRAARQVGIIHYPRWPHVMGPPAPPPPAPPPVAPRPPRPPRQAAPVRVRGHARPRKPDAPAPWEALPKRVRKGVRAALAARAALARHGLTWGRDPYDVITAAIRAEKIRRASEPPPSPAVVASLTAREVLDQANFAETSLLQLREWLMGHGRDLAAKPSPPHDRLSANVYADWLEDNGEPAAAAKLRQAFPLDDGTGSDGNCR